MAKEIRKEFWDESDHLLNKCTDNELVVLKSRVEKEISKRCEKWDKKLNNRKGKK